MTIVNSALTGFNGIDFNFNSGGGAYCCATDGCDTTTITYANRCSRFDVSLPCFYEEFFQTITLGDCVCSGQWSSDGTCTPPSCAAGQYMESGTCTSCPVDTYQDNANFMGTACTACPAGSSTLGATGSTAITACKCNAGYSGPDGGTCSACDTDKYKSIAGPVACTARPTSSSTVGLTGSTAITACSVLTNVSVPNRGWFKNFIQYSRCLYIWYNHTGNGVTVWCFGLVPVRFQQVSKIHTKFLLNPEVKNGVIQRPGHVL